MADYQDLQTIANDAAFRGRCQIALVTQALYEMANASAQTLTPQYVAFCNAAINNQVDSYALALSVLTASAVASAATVASLPGCTAVSDSLILSAIAINFNSLAGIPAN